MRVLLWALAGAAMWGIGPIFDRWALRNASPLLATLLRVGTAGIGASLVLLMGWGQWGEALRKLPASTWGFLAASGLFGSILGPLAYFFALREGETSQVVPLASSSPIFTALLAMLLLHESISLARWMGILLIVVGIALVQR